MPPRRGCLLSSDPAWCALKAKGRFRNSIISRHGRVAAQRNHETRLQAASDDGRRRYTVGLSKQQCSFRNGWMLSKKVFLAGEPNFSAPPVHAARADVRDHVESQEGDHSASYAYDRGLQERRQANIVFREIWGAAQFSTFSTASTRSRPGLGTPFRPPICGQAS